MSVKRSIESWGGGIAKRAHELTIVDSHEDVVIGGIAPDEAEFVAAGNKVSELLALIVEIHSCHFNGNVSVMADEVGFSTRAANILSSFPEKIRNEVFARGDIVRHGDKWKLVELNIGTTVGGIFYASMPRLNGLQQSYDVLSKWAELSVKNYGLDGNIVFVEDSKYVEYMRLSLHVMSRELENILKRKIEIIGHKDLSWDGKQLFGSTGPVDCIYRLFNEKNVLDAEDEYYPIIAAVRSGAVKCPMGPNYNVLSNKGILALLWERACSGLLSPSQEELVREFIPKTQWMNASNSTWVIESRESLVIKPIDGSAGYEVYIGEEMDQLAWRKRVMEIIHGSEGKAYVAQEYVKPELMNVLLADRFGNIREEYQRVIWGLFTFGSEFLGGFIRSKPDLGTMVINHANGASVGPIPPSAWSKQRESSG